MTATATHARLEDVGLREATAAAITVEAARTARNHAPLPTVIAEAAGAGVNVVGRTGRVIFAGLLARGSLAKHTHRNMVRLAPPLPGDEADLDWALDQLAAELAD